MKSKMKQKKIKIKKDLGKVVVAMSGGVDSSVAAALLKKRGYEVTGVFMQFWYPEGEEYGENRCCSLESWQEAVEVAKKIGIPIHKVNFGRQFKKVIVDEFLKAYKEGLTPNPCVACNKFIKFDLLWAYAKTVLGADYLATGHYIRLSRKFQISNSKFLNKKLVSNLYLERSKDLNKDQTYFLYNLKPELLNHLLFPLGDYKKEEVRTLAKRLKLTVHNKKDSQEVCFVGKSNNDFLKRYLKLKPGKIVEKETGKVLGVHNGLALYTLGQRSGIGLSGGPWYVCGFERKKNVLYITKNSEAKDLYVFKVNFEQANWLEKGLKFPLKLKAQVRYQGKEAECVVKKFSRGYVAEFKKPQKSVMSGQSIVFYDKNRLMGGGIIK